MNKLTLLSLTALAAIFIAADPNCSPKNTSKSSKKPDLYGKWQWLRTSCCYTSPKISNPENTGENRTLELRSDKTFTLTKNGVAESGTFELKVGLDILNKADSTKLIRIGDDHAAAIYSFQGDTMILNRGYMDLETEYYLRKKE